jgi:hypothetical protein
VPPFSGASYTSPRNRHPDYSARSRPHTDATGVRTANKACYGVACQQQDAAFLPGGSHPLADSSSFGAFDERRKIRIADVDGVPPARTGRCRGTVIRRCVLAGERWTNTNIEGYGRASADARKQSLLSAPVSTELFDGCQVTVGLGEPLISPAVYCCNTRTQSGGSELASRTTADWPANKRADCALPRITQLASQATPLKPLSIRGFGVQVPGGAPVVRPQLRYLSWGFML